MVGGTKREGRRAGSARWVAPNGSGRWEWRCVEEGGAGGRWGELMGDCRPMRRLFCELDNSRSFGAGGKHFEIEVERER